MYQCSNLLVDNVDLHFSLIW